MYIHLNKQIIHELCEKNIIYFVSLWDTTENVIGYYSKKVNLFTSYEDNNSTTLPNSTRIRVFVCPDVDQLMKFRDIFL